MCAPLAPMRLDRAPAHADKSQQKTGKATFHLECPYYSIENSAFSHSEWSLPSGLSTALVLSVLAL